MLTKDFENFEARLQTLREESHEDFVAAEKNFDETYRARLEELFPRDILGAKKEIAGRFIVGSVDSPEQKSIFEDAVKNTIHTLPLSLERKNQLSNNILRNIDVTQSANEYFRKNDEISRDPFFALVEDFAIDGDISHEEYILLQQSYDTQGDFLKALESLPDNLKDLFHSHIALTLSHQNTQKRGEFESEFSHELSDLQNKGLNIEPVIAFVSKSFYKTPGKYRKYEHPKRRMRRTFKLALLKLLRSKIGNIDAKIMLEKFEQGESFEDFFMLLFKLMEIVNENPNGKEVFTILSVEDEIQDDVFTAEENKKKIMQGESLIMSIASLFSTADSKKEEEELGEGMLEKILDESTDIVGEDIYFNREDENAGVYAENTSSLGEQDEEEEEVNYDAMSPETAYEMLKHKFHKIEESKTQAFLLGEYDEIDMYNESLLFIQTKLEKLSKILGRNNVNS